MGLGLIGISIGLALKQSVGQQSFLIVGHDKNIAAAEYARKVKAVDRTDSNLVSAIAAADLVILDLP
ncbi:MAG: prephenate dehydrogenase/arogenate dehydrogenase family protein, partial [Anaerolineae bacterium]